MHTKLTLRMEDAAVRKAKAEAHRRGKSVSVMVEEFFDAIREPPLASKPLPPITRSLIGVLKGASLDESDYRRHLREKHQ